MIICDTCHQTIDYMQDDDEYIIKSLNKLIDIASESSIKDTDKFAQVIELLVEAKSILEIGKESSGECSPALLNLMRNMILPFKTGKIIKRMKIKIV